MGLLVVGGLWVPWSFVVDGECGGGGRRVCGVWGGALVVVKGVWRVGWGDGG